MSRSVLFIGGTGTISWWCVRAALEAGWHVAALTRGRSQIRPLPDEVEAIQADVADDAAFAAALQGQHFDVVADFLSFDVDRLRRNVSVVGPNTSQYVFISSASAYQKPVRMLPITESTPLVNPYWEYSRKKIACEDYLMGLVRSGELDATIVRPSHTYDAAASVSLGGWTDVARMRAGKPVVVHGDGTSLWTLTHSSDFATAFVPLLGSPHAVGQAFHITSDEVLPWDLIYAELAAAAGVPNAPLVHVASETIGRLAPKWHDGLVGDKAHSVVFDNRKVRAVAPRFVQRIAWATGVRQYVDFHDSHPDYAAVSAEDDALFDQLVKLAAG
ncbi:MAG: NAD-dependent epimerase/dehydratase family protein [Bifidobacteriaceae bacterium]|jgi:nucleoside-diphosphate-sugar epimerase|nr:NAD-dependent epimerase/dehydratase family protein [Bifidobacteriaceae bacterium]